MTTSIRSMPIIAIFVAAAIVPVASAGASVNEPVLAGYYSAAPVDTSSGSTSLTALSHDSSPTVALHRDSSEAVPFVADLGPEPTTASGDGFDWGDAAVGAGAVLLVACLAMFAAAGISGRRGRTSQPTAASQSA
jgi:hypothetical protein